MTWTSEFPTRTGWNWIKGWDVGRSCQFKTTIKVPDGTPVIGNVRDLEFYGPITTSEEEATNDNEV